MATCIDCGREFEPALGACREVVGWLEDGSTSLRDKTYTGRVRCPDCGKLRRFGASVGQQGLFPEGLF